MRTPKIPHGITAFGLLATGTTAYIANKRANAAKIENAGLREELRKSTKKVDDLTNKVDGLTNKVDDLHPSARGLVNDVKKDLETLITKTKLISNSIFHFSIPSINDLKEYFNLIFNYLNNFSLQDQILIFNSLNSFFILSLFFSFIMGKYANYLVDKFNLVNKFPKLSKLFHYRLQVQKYYYLYLSILAVSALLFNLFINLSILFS